MGKVEQWISFTQTNIWPFAPLMYAVYGHRKIAEKEFTEQLDKFKALCKTLDAQLKGKSYLVGDAITLADVICACSFIGPF